MESTPTMPPDLASAIASEPVWLQTWVMLLGVVLIASLLFVVTRREGRFRLRGEALAILASAVAAAILMNWLYGVVGYVRLLGLAHLVPWTPVYLWIAGRRRRLAPSLYRRYIDLYLVIVGTSLVVDLIDLVRWLFGDGELLHRWS